jgi:predicted DNA-binding transcriptional regulator AlpA
MGTMQRPAESEYTSQTSPLEVRDSARLLLTAKQAAAACGKSLRTWRSWDSAGRIPRPVRIHRTTMWRFDELQKWVEAGCPRRDEWEART